MKIYIKQIIIIAIACICVACATVPITGRKQLNLLPQSELNAMGLQGYSEFMDTAKVSTNKRDVAMVKRAGEKIAAAVEQYLKDNGMENQISNFAWEFQLVEDRTPNAWCMPGGKIVFYSGILPYTKNETGIAVVMGHEIAHEVARHGNERMSQQMGMQAVAAGLQYALNNEPQRTQMIYQAAFGLGSQYGVLLPFSRKHEKEADRLGLIFMALAGYDPAEAVDFWTNMSKNGGQKVPEFLSTHPADDTRITEIKAFIPEAQKYYKPEN